MNTEYWSIDRHSLILFSNDHSSWYEKALCLKQRGGLYKSRVKQSGLMWKLNDIIWTNSLLSLFALPSLECRLLVSWYQTSPLCSSVSKTHRLSCSSAVLKWEPGGTCSVTGSEHLWEVGFRRWGNLLNARCRPSGLLSQDARLGCLQTAEMYCPQFWRVEVQDQGASMVDKGSLLSHFMRLLMIQIQGEGIGKYVWSLLHKY